MDTLRTSLLVADTAGTVATSDISRPLAILLPVVLRATAVSNACVVLAAADGTYSIAANFGDVASFADASRLVERSLREPLLIIEQTCDDSDAAALARREIGFYASAAFVTEPGRRGFLCIHARDARAISSAQQYVLQTLAAEISALISSPRTRSAEDEERDLQKVRLRLLESVVVHANDSVLITEADPVDLPGPRILYANAAFTRTTGYELDEIIGKTPRILQGEQTDPAIRRRLREALQQWQPIEVELLNYRKDGTTFWSELSIVPVADGSGQFTHWVSVQRDVTERKNAEELAVRARVAQAENAALSYRAYHDELTGLANRAAFLQAVTGAIGAVDDGRSSAVLFLDVDRFKLVNDSLGHRVGDLLLIEIARRLRTCARSNDVIARFGGDEFTCLLTGVNDHEEVVNVARRIVAALREPIRLAGQAIPVAVSIGIEFIGNPKAVAEDVLRDADTAMYRAKNDGGNRFVFFDDTMHLRAVTTLRAQTDLQGALARQEFVLQFQPLVEVATGRTFGFEALVRWNHPVRGTISPLEFIPMAEDTGLIVDLGRWILVEACRHAQRWNAERPADQRLTISVNVSSRQLDEHDFYDVLVQALDATGLDPRSLQLEITEGVFLEHQASVGTLLQQIRALGVRIALDDFGTGYSSLSYLERFPIDVLKIDRSFVARLATSPTAFEIVQLIVGIAKALKMEVTAEGIEDDQQRDAVVRTGCAHVQGYLFGRPLDVDAVPAALAKGQ